MWSSFMNNRQWKIVKEEQNAHDDIKKYFMNSCHFDDDFNFDLKY